MTADAERPSGFNEQLWDLTAATEQSTQLGEETATPDSRGKVVGLYALSTGEIVDALMRRPAITSLDDDMPDRRLQRTLHDFTASQPPIVTPELAAKFPGYPTPTEKPMMELREISNPTIIHEHIKTKLHEKRIQNDYQYMPMEIAPKKYDY